MELDLDVMVGEERGELDELIPEIFDKLVIDVGDPSLHLDRYILEHDMYTLLLLQNRLDTNHMLVTESTNHLHFL